MELIFLIAVACVPLSFVLAILALQDARRFKELPTGIKFALIALISLRIMPAFDVAATWMTLVLRRGLPNWFGYWLAFSLGATVIVLPPLSFLKKLQPQSKNRLPWIVANVATAVVGIGVYFAAAIFSLPL